MVVVRTPSTPTSISSTSSSPNTSHPKNPYAMPQDTDPATSQEPESLEESRGRLKRRRMSSHSPPRAPSPSRGHDRDSGSRHRHHHRKHHRPSSPSSLTPPSSGQNHRRRSDAEPDHTLRGRVRNRSGSRGRTQSALFEDDESSEELDVGVDERSFRKRSAPPSRHRIEDRGEENEGIRRQRSYPNLYKGERRDSMDDEEEAMDEVPGMAGEDGGASDRLAVPAS